MNNCLIKLANYEAAGLGRGINEREMCPAGLGRWKHALAGRGGQVRLAINALLVKSRDWGGLCLVRLGLFDKFVVQ